MKNENKVAVVYGIAFVVMSAARYSALKKLKRKQHQRVIQHHMDRIFDNMVAHYND